MRERTWNRDFAMEKRIRFFFFKIMYFFVFVFLIFKLKKSKKTPSFNDFFVSSIAQNRSLLGPLEMVQMSQLVSFIQSRYIIKWNTLIPQKLQNKQPAAGYTPRRRVILCRRRAWFFNIFDFSNEPRII